MKLKHYLIPAVALLCASCQQNSNFADGLLEVEGGQIQGYKDDGLTSRSGRQFRLPAHRPFRASGSRCPSLCDYGQVLDKFRQIR